jgi:hypothetical protein
MAGQIGTVKVDEKVNFTIKIYGSDPRFTDCPFSAVSSTGRAYAGAFSKAAGEFAFAELKAAGQLMRVKFGSDGRLLGIPAGTDPVVRAELGALGNALVLESRTDQAARDFFDRKKMKFGGWVLP